MDLSEVNKVLSEGSNKLTSVHAIVVLVIVFLSAYLLSRLVAKLVISIAKSIALRSDTTSDEERSIQLRRIETYLSVMIASARGVIFAIALYVALRFLLPNRGALVSTIGIGTFFVVFANATIATSLPV